MTTKRATYHGMEGFGETKKAAMENAKRRVEAALAGEYTPWYFTGLGHTLIVWRELEGWTYRIIRPDEEPRGRLVAITWGPDCGDFLSVRAGALRHFAQTVYFQTADIPAGLAALLTPDVLEEHRRHCQWQDTYRLARERGAADELARKIADGRHLMIEPAECPHSNE